VSNLQHFDVRNCGSRLDFDPCACLGYVRCQASTINWACMNDQLMTASIYVYVSPALYLLTYSTQLLIDVFYIRLD